MNRYVTAAAGHQQAWPSRRRTHAGTLGASATPSTGPGPPDGPAGGARPPGGGTAEPELSQRRPPPGCAGELLQHLELQECPLDGSGGRAGGVRQVGQPGLRLVCDGGADPGRCLEAAEAAGRRRRAAVAEPGQRRGSHPAGGVHQLDAHGETGPEMAIFAGPQRGRGVAGGAAAEGSRSATGQQRPPRDQTSMDTGLAARLHDAMALGDHPLLDWRTPEAKARTAWMRDHLPPFVGPGKALLDLGCGCGKHTFQAGELGLRATGLDCSPGMISRALRVGKAIESNAGFVVGDYCRTPFGDDTFDSVLFPRNIVECSYEGYTTLVAEVGRVLKRGGLFLLTLRGDAEPARWPEAADRPNVAVRPAGSTVTIPGRGTYSYPTWRWTVPLADFVTTMHLDAVTNLAIDSRGGWLVVYRKGCDRSGLPT